MKMASSVCRLPSRPSLLLAMAAFGLSKAQEETAMESDCPKDPFAMDPLPRWPLWH